MFKFKSPDKIKEQEENREDSIIDTVFQKRIGGGSQKTEVFAEKDKGGYVPTHDKHSHGNAHDSSSKRIDISQVFRRQVQWIGTEVFHKCSVNSSEQDKPE